MCYIYKLGQDYVAARYGGETLASYSGRTQQFRGQLAFKDKLLEFYKEKKRTQQTLEDKASSA